MMLPRGRLEGKITFQPRAKRFMAIASLGMLAFASGCSAEIPGNSSPMGPGGAGPGPVGGSGSGTNLPNAGQGGTTSQGPNGGSGAGKTGPGPGQGGTAAGAPGQGGTGLGEDQIGRASCRERVSTDV